MHQQVSTESELLTYEPNRSALLLQFVAPDSRATRLLPIGHHPDIITLMSLEPGQRLAHYAR